MKKANKFFGMIFAALTTLSLFLPIFKATFTDGESMTLLLRVYDLYEFSTWGLVAMLCPLVVAVFVLIKLDYKIKRLLVVCTCILGCVGAFEGFFAMSQWVYANATGSVEMLGGLIYFMTFFVCTCVFWFVFCMKTKNENQ